MISVSFELDKVEFGILIPAIPLPEIKAVTSCSTHKIDQQETDG